MDQFQNARLEQLIQLITTKTEQYGSFLVDAISCKNKIGAEYRKLMRRLNTRDPEFNPLKVQSESERLSNLRLLIWFQLLGFDSGETGVNYAIQILSLERNSVERHLEGSGVQILAYLTCVLLLPNYPYLSLLLGQQLQLDLGVNQSNVRLSSVAISLSLETINTETTALYLPLLTGLFQHENPIVRQRAALAVTSLIRRGFVQVTGEYVRMMKTILADPDPRVMLAALEFLKHELLWSNANDANCKKFQNLIPIFCDILSQILDGKFPSFLVHGKTPAPWIQISIIQILTKLYSEYTVVESKELIRDFLSKEEKSFTKSNLAVQFEFLRLDLKIAFCESSLNESKVVDRIVHTLDGWLNPNENIMLQLGSLHILNEFASIRCELFDFLMDRYRKHIMDIAKNCMDVDMTLSAVRFLSRDSSLQNAVSRKEYLDTIWQIVLLFESKFTRPTDYADFASRILNTLESASSTDLLPFLIHYPGSQRNVNLSFKYSGEPMQRLSEMLKNWRQLPVKWLPDLILSIMKQLEVNHFGDVNEKEIIDAVFDILRANETDSIYWDLCLSSSKLFQISSWTATELYKSKLLKLSSRTLIQILMTKSEHADKPRRLLNNDSITSLEETLKQFEKKSYSPLSRDQSLKLKAYSAPANSFAAAQGQPDNISRPSTISLSSGSKPWSTLGYAAVEQSEEFDPWRQK